MQNDYVALRVLIVVRAGALHVLIRAQSKHVARSKRDQSSARVSLHTPIRDCGRKAHRAVMDGTPPPKHMAMTSFTHFLSSQLTHFSWLAILGLLYSLGCNTDRTTSCGVQRGAWGQGSASSVPPSINNKHEHIRSPSQASCLNPPSTTTPDMHVDVVKPLIPHPSRVVLGVIHEKTSYAD